MNGSNNRSVNSTVRYQLFWTALAGQPMAQDSRPILKILYISSKQREPEKNCDSWLYISEVDWCDNKMCEFYTNNFKGTSGFFISKAYAAACDSQNYIDSSKQMFKGTSGFYKLIWCCRMSFTKLQWQL